MTPDPYRPIPGAAVETIGRWLKHNWLMSVATHRAEPPPRPIDQAMSVIWIKADAMHAP